MPWLAMIHDGCAQTKLIFWVQATLCWKPASATLTVWEQSTKAEPMRISYPPVLRSNSREDYSNSSGLPKSWQSRSAQADPRIALQFPISKRQSLKSRVVDRDGSK